MSSHLSCLGPRRREEEDVSYSTEARAAVGRVIGGVASGLSTAGSAFVDGVASGYGIVEAKYGFDEPTESQSLSCMGTG